MDPAAAAAGGGDHVLPDLDGLDGLDDLLNQIPFEEYLNTLPESLKGPSNAIVKVGAPRLQIRLVVPAHTNATARHSCSSPMRIHFCLPCHIAGASQSLQQALLRPQRD